MNVQEQLGMAAAVSVGGAASMFAATMGCGQAGRSAGEVATTAPNHAQPHGAVLPGAALLGAVGGAADAATCQRLFGHLSDVRSGPAAAAAGGGSAGAASAGGEQDRDSFLDRYAAWLDARHTELVALPGAERRPIALGLLQQLEGVLLTLPGGVYPDLQTLDRQPQGNEALQSALLFSCPPRLVGAVRKIIAQVERRGPGRQAGANPEGAPDGGAGFDWNTHLGVPQYRTQSDNLAGPETTCSITAMAMALERLGYGRPEVMAAVQRELRRLYFQEQQPRLGREPTAEELASLTLPADYFQNKAHAYVAAENDRPKVKMRNGTGESSYPRPRGVTLTDEQVSTISEEYEGEAQLEDLLDFLRYLHDENRTGAQQWGDREEFLSESNDILAAIAPDDEDRPQMTQLELGKVTWAQVRTRVDLCLRAGGSAMVSIYHKGSTSSKSHIITVQSVVAGGMIVDDPYGAINNTYDRRTNEDAFAPDGSTKRTAQYKNQIDRDAKGPDDIDGVGDDWKVEYAQNLEDNESLGDSHTVPDAVLEHAWRYVRLLERPSTARRRHAQLGVAGASVEAGMRGAMHAGQQGLERALGSMY